jgi:hypothetical protein
MLEFSSYLLLVAINEKLHIVSGIILVNFGILVERSPLQSSNKLSLIILHQSNVNFHKRTTGCNIGLTNMQDNGFLNKTFLGLSAFFVGQFQSILSIREPKLGVLSARSIYNVLQCPQVESSIFLFDLHTHSRAKNFQCAKHFLLVALLHSLVQFAERVYH